MKRLKGNRYKKIRLIATLLLILTVGCITFADFSYGMSVFDFSCGMPTIGALTIAIAPVALTDEQKIFLGVIQDQVKEQLTEFKKNSMSLDDYNQKTQQLIDQMKGKVDQAKLDELTEIARKQGETIQALKEKGAEPSKQITLGQALFNTFKENHEQIIAQKGSKGMQSFAVKTVADMVRANSNSSLPYAVLEPGMTRIATRKPFLRDIMNTAATAKSVIYYAEQANRDGTTIETAENASKNQIDFDIVLSSIEAKKIPAYIKVSEEMIEDIDFIQGEIDNELVEQVNLRLDAQLLSGVGTSVYLKGIDAFVTSTLDVTGTQFAANVPSANNLDVLRVAVAYVEGKLFMPTYILLHPHDAALMELQKDDLGGYVLPPFWNNSKQIAGVPIITNTGITAGNFYVGDFSKANLRIRKDMTLKVGYDGNDFTKNMMTILAELRAAHYIKTNHVDAFTRGSFATVLSAIQKNEN